MTTTLQSTPGSHPARSHVLLHHSVRRRSPPGSRFLDRTQPVVDSSTEPRIQIYSRFLDRTPHGSRFLDRTRVSRFLDRTLTLVVGSSAEPLMVVGSSTEPRIVGSSTELRTAVGSSTEPGLVGSSTERQQGSRFLDQTLVVGSSAEPPPRRPRVVGSRFLNRNHPLQITHRPPLASSVCQPAPIFS